MPAVQKLGITSIETSGAGFGGALGKERSERTIGSSIWPKIGFDAEIPAHKIMDLPPSLKDAKTIQDLYDTKEGQHWWEENAEPIHMTIDLSDLNAKGTKRWMKWASRTKGEK